MIPTADNIKNYINPDITPRRCQSECFDALIKENKCISSMITGSGKSIIEYALINYAFYHHNINLIVTDSIALTQQLAIDYNNHSLDNIEIVLFNSGKLRKKTVFNNWMYETYNISSDNMKSLTYDEIEYYNCEFETYTKENDESVKELSIIIDSINNITSTLKDSDIPTDRKVLVVSTYESFNKLSGIQFGTTVFDEAHRSNTSRFHKDLKKLKSEHQYFFTSTPTGDLKTKSGMANEKIYGKIKYELKYIDAVNYNIIIPFALTTLINHEVDNDVDNTKHISGAHQFTSSIIKSELLNKTYETPKIIINLDRIDQSEYTFDKLIEDNIQSNLYIIVGNIRKKYDYKTKTISNYKTKSEIMDIIRLDNDVFCIINIKMLNVGIDVPSLTTLGVLSASNSTRLLQSIGRILRLDDKDKHKSYNIDNINYDMVKPFGTVYMNSAGNNKDDNSKIMSKSVKFMMSYFGCMLAYLDNDKIGRTSIEGEDGEDGEDKIFQQCTESYTTELEKFIIRENNEFNVQTLLNYDDPSVYINWAPQELLNIL